MIINKVLAQFKYFMATLVLDVEERFEMFRIARQKAVVETEKYFNENYEFIREERRKLEFSDKKISIFQSGVEPVNFIYGELEFVDFYSTLQFVFQNYWLHSLSINNVFLDLGCGAGNLSKTQMIASRLLIDC